MRFVSTAVIILNVAAVFAQMPMVVFDQFNEDDGIPHQSVHTIFQDRDGVLWMLSFDGLMRYNGYDFHTFQHSPVDTTTLSGNHLTAIHEDFDGRLWVAALGRGLNVSDPGKTRFERFSSHHNLLQTRQETSDTTEYRITAITHDANRKIWVGGTHGLQIFSMRNGAFVLDSLHEVVQDAIGVPFAVTALYRDHRDRMWIGTSQGIMMYDHGTRSMSTPHSHPGYIARIIDDIEQAPDSTIWISCKTVADSSSGTTQVQLPRLYYQDGDSDGFMSFAELIPESAHRTIKFAFDHHKRLWMSVFGEQLYGYDFTDSVMFLRSSKNSNVSHMRFMRDPFIDHEGGIWIPGPASAGSGIYRYQSPLGVQHFQHQFAFDQTVHAIGSINNEIWLASFENGIVRVDPDLPAVGLLSTTTTDPGPLPSNHVMAITQLSSGKVAMAAFDMLILCDPLKFRMEYRPVRGTCRAVFEDSKHRLWLGGNQGLYQFTIDGEFLNKYSLPSRYGNSSNNIQTIQEDHDGNIWFAGGNKGIAKLDPETQIVKQLFSIEGDPRALPSDKVFDLHYHKKVIWIATDVGLVKYDMAADTFTTFSISRGLNDQHISSVMATDSGIWVSTNSGISFLNPASWQFENFTESDGLLNKAYNNRCKFVDDDGRIYFGGSRGVDYFKPDAFSTGRPLFRMQVVSLSVNQKQIGQPLLSTNPIELKYNDIIEVEFAGLTFRHPEQIEYAYRIEGLQEEWTLPSRGRRAMIANLKPGHYTFYARGRHPHGDWSTEQVVIPMDIKPPFWATWWFRGMLLALGIYAIISLVQRREKRIVLREKKENEIQKTMLELEKRALLAQMNPHFIFNAMNSIQRFIAEKNNEGALRYLSKFSRLLRIILNISGENSISLADEIKLIKDYLELESMRFPNKFTYTIHVDEEVDVPALEIPPFLIQPQVENAIMHGLLRKKSNGHLRIAISQENALVRVCVEDNGIGRKAAKQLRERTDLYAESKGISIVEQRLRHLNQDSKYHEVFITDLYTEENVPCGTRVEIFLQCD